MMQSTESKQPWVPLRLTYVGDLTAIVQATGSTIKTPIIKGDADAEFPVPPESAAMMGGGNTTDPGIP